MRSRRDGGRGRLQRTDSRGSGCPGSMVPSHSDEISGQGSGSDPGFERHHRQDRGEEDSPAGPSGIERRRSGTKTPCTEQKSQIGSIHHAVVVGCPRVEIAVCVEVPKGDREADSEDEMPSASSMLRSRAPRMNEPLARVSSRWDRTRPLRRRRGPFITPRKRDSPRHQMQAPQ